MPKPAIYIQHENGSVQSMESHEVVLPEGFKEITEEEYRCIAETPYLLENSIYAIKQAEQKKGKKK